MIVWRQRSSQRCGLLDRFEDKDSSLALPVKPRPQGDDQTLKNQVASRTGFSNFSRSQNHLDGLSTHLPGTTPSDSESRSEEDPTTCIMNRFPGDSDAVTWSSPGLGGDLFDQTTRFLENLRAWLLSRLMCTN